MPKRISLKGQGAALFFGTPAPLSSALLSEPSSPLNSKSRTPAAIAHGAQAVDQSSERLVDQPHSESPSSTRTFARTPGRNNASNDRTLLPRPTTRHAFELFQDQIIELRRLALEEKLAGDDGNMSDMVRKAVDTYLAVRRRGGHR